jgi:hypothetical protein
MNTRNRIEIERSGYHKRNTNKKEKQYRELFTSLTHPELIYIFILYFMEILHKKTQPQKCGRADLINYL